MVDPAVEKYNKLKEWVSPRSREKPLPEIVYPLEGEYRKLVNNAASLLNRSGVLDNMFCRDKNRIRSVQRNGQWVQFIGMDHCNQRLRRQARMVWYLLEFFQTEDVPPLDNETIVGLMHFIEKVMIRDTIYREFSTEAPVKKESVPVREEVREKVSEEIIRGAMLYSMEDDEDYQRRIQMN